MQYSLCYRTSKEFLHEQLCFVKDINTASFRDHLLGINGNAHSVCWVFELWIWPIYTSLYSFYEEIINMGCLSGGVWTWGNDHSNKRYTVTKVIFKSDPSVILLIVSSKDHQMEARIFPDPNPSCNRFHN